MTRKDLMTLIALTTGLSLAGPAFAAPKADKHAGKAAQSQPLGYIRSGNPKAFGGPLNPGRGNPHNAY